MNINSILVKELAKAGAVGGFVYRDAITAIAGAKGAAFAAQILPTVDHLHTVAYNGALENAIRAAFAALRNTAGFREFIEIVPAPEVLEFSAVIDSGVQYMNPAVVCVTFEYNDGENTKIHISGSAKEGLIKQNTAMRAVLLQISNQTRRR